MKITKSQFVQLIKESYQKRMLSEAGNEQGDNLDKDDLTADVLTVLNQINSKIQGKAEWLQFAAICLEFLLEYKFEGATDTELHKAMKQAGGKNGTRLYALLKIIAQEQTKKEKEKQDLGKTVADMPALDPNEKTQRMSSLADKTVTDMPPLER
jgi:hypothetical protein